MRKAFWASVYVFFWAPLFASAQYYSFKENSSAQWPSQWLAPAEMFVQVARTTNDLLQWTHHTSQRPEASEKYNRLEHFGIWIDDPRDSDCYDVRALILMRDSKTPVKFSSGNSCKVFSGSWYDPYGGSTWKFAREMEIDHVVALKNAYVSGAWAWDKQHRCLFANFMGYKNHLISSSSRENKMKGDRGPESWMPTDENYACQHLHNWLAVKFIWNLTMSRAEAQAITDMIQSYRCEVKDFQFLKSELSRIRRYAKENLALCKNL